MHVAALPGNDRPGAADMTHIFDELEADAERLGHGILNHLTQHHYPENDQVWSPAKGTTAVSLTTLVADVKNDLATLEQNAADDYNRVKAAVENKFPEFERVGQLIDSDPLVQIALGELVPAPLRQFAADAVTTLVKAFQAAPQAPAAAEPAAPDVHEAAGEAPAA